MTAETQPTPATPAEPTADAVVLRMIREYLATPDAEAFMRSKVQDSVKRHIESALASYSKLGKQIEEAVEKALRIDGKLDLPSYNQMIIKFVELQVQNLAETAIQKTAAARLKELLTPAPEKIKLSELLEQYRKELEEEQDDGCVCYGDDEDLSIGCSVTDRETGGFRGISLREKASDKNESIYIGITKEGKVYHIRFADQAIETKLFVGPVYGFERMVYQMKAAGTIIEVDDYENVETYYGPDHL